MSTSLLRRVGSMGGGAGAAAGVARRGGCSCTAGRPAERAARARLLTLNPSRNRNRTDLPAEHAVDLLHVPLLVEEVEEDALLLLVVHRAPGPLRGSTSAACTGEALRRRKGGRYLSAKRGRGGGQTGQIPAEG